MYMGNILIELLIIFDTDFIFALELNWMTSTNLFTSQESHNTHTKTRQVPSNQK